MTAMFDTLKFARTLRDGGSFTPDQAERLSDALADAMAGEVVGRADLKTTETTLRGEIRDLRAELKSDIAELRAELKGDIAALRTELKGDIAELRTETHDSIAELRTELRTGLKGVEARIEAAQANTIRWVIGLFGVQVVALLGGLVALARLLPR